MRKPATEADQEGPGILIVDDAPANVRLLADMLKDRGYKIRVALSGERALQAAHNHPPSLILLDVNMPEMNGYEVCGQLKADAELRDIPVIFISAMHETMDKVKAFGVGGVDYITKPFQVEEVEARVRTHLELHRQRHELRRSYARLRELENLRDTLVHMIIHDLRNPLSVIHGNLGVVLESEALALAPKNRKFLETALAVSSSLAEMISSILDVNRMEAGAMKLNLGRCDLVAVAARVLAGAEAIRGRRNLAMEASGGPVEVVADADILFRVIQNLVDNALKFTPADGWIRLAITPDGDHVHVAVKDNGPGIPEAYQRMIFDKFGQVAGFEHQQKYATGLGLTFCKMAVEAHGGRIGVESREGLGSSFWFDLPLKGM